MLIPFSWNNDNEANEQDDAITTLTEYADKIAFSENMKAFKFEPVETGGGGVLAFCAYQVAGYIFPNDTVSFTFQGSTITLTASPTPTNGEFWTDANVVFPLTQTYLSKVAESIADALLQVLSFKTNYTISGAGSGAAIYAKAHGASENITAVSSTIQIWTGDNAGTAKYESENYIDYSGFCQLYVGNEVYEESVDKFQAELIDEYLIDSTTQAAQIAVNSVGSYVQPVKPLKSLVESNDPYQMDLGTTGAGIVIPDENPDDARRYVLRPYFLIYGDSYRFVENGQRKRFIKGVTPVRWVQLGAFDKLRPYDLQNYVWMPEQSKEFSWLTSTPNCKTVTYDSHEFLQVICKRTTQDIQAKINLNIRFYDGTTTNVQKAAFSAADLAGNLSFDVSPVALGLESYELLVSGKKIDWYEVSLQWTSGTGDTITSDSFKYVFDRECYRTKYQVIYLNEFGAWDSIEFRGAMQKNKSRQAEKLIRPLPFNANKPEAISAEVSVNTRIDTDTATTIYSGLMSSAHHEHAKNILDSSAVYIWNAVLKAYESINIIDYSYQFNTLNGGAGMSITFNRTVSDNTITR